MSRGENITLVPAISLILVITHNVHRASFPSWCYVPAHRKYEAWDIPRIHQYSVELAHNQLTFIHCQHTIREEASALVKA